MTKLLLVNAIVALVGLVSQLEACGGPPPGGTRCCTQACPLFTPCWLTAPCPAPIAPPINPLSVLQNVFASIGTLFQSIENTLPAGSPALAVLQQVFTGISAIFGNIETQFGRRKRESEPEEIDVKSGKYGYAGKKHKDKLGHKSATAANEAKEAIKSFKQETGQDVERLIRTHRHKSAEERKKAFKEGMEKHGKEAKEKMEKVLAAHAATLVEIKDATDKHFEKMSPEAKEAGKKLYLIIVDEKMTPLEKEDKVDDFYTEVKPEVIKELKLMDKAYIKRACHMASSPFGTVGDYRVPLKYEF